MKVGSAPCMYHATKIRLTQFDLAQMYFTLPSVWEVCKLGYVA